MELKDIRPQASSFKLKLTGKQYKLRPMTLTDEMWIQEEFGNDIEKVFAEIQMRPICRIVYRLLENKELLKKQKVKIQNELGEEATEEIGGVDLLMASISGNQEKLDIYLALMDTIGISRPIRKKLGVEEQGTEKKSLKKPSRGKK